MKKTVFTLFLLLFCGILFCGAGFDSKAFLNKNAFRLTRQIESDGSVKTSYVFPVNSDVVLENGDENDLKTYKFYLFSYVLALASQNKAKEVEGVEVGNVAYYTDVDGIGFSISFDSVDAQKKFFGNGNTENESTAESKTKTSGFFMQKTELETPFPFSKDSAQSYKQICVLAINSWCKESGKNAEIYTKALEDSVFIYDFASPDKNLKSEQMYHGEKLFHNVFVKTQSEIESSPTIVFYTQVPNVAVWYGLAVVVTVGGSFLSYLILKNNKKHLKESKNK